MRGRTSSPAPAPTSSTADRHSRCSISTPRACRPRVAAELKRLGGFWPALLTVLPALSGVAHVDAALDQRRTVALRHRRSVCRDRTACTSMSRARTAPTSSDSCETLHERCWLRGLGWMMVSASGALLERSIVDRMVGGPERLVFEGGPILVPPLQQDQDSRRPVAVDGEVLDTVAAARRCRSSRRARLDERKARERERLAPEVAKARAAFIERAGQEAGRAHRHVGAGRQADRSMRQCEGVLRPDVELPFDDPELAGCTVGDVLADPERFEGETLADPLEGVDYGRCMAKIMRRADGTPWIHSFAHGRTIYELKLDAASVRKAMEAAAKDDVVATLRQARRGRRPRRGRAGGAAPAGQEALRRRPARDRRRAEGGAAEARRADAKEHARTPCRPTARPAAA